MLSGELGQRRGQLRKSFNAKKVTTGVETRRPNQKRSLEAVAAERRRCIRTRQERTRQRHCLGHDQSGDTSEILSGVAASGDGDSGGRIDHGGWGKTQQGLRCGQSGSGKIGVADCIEDDLVRWQRRGEIVKLRIQNIGLKNLVVQQMAHGNVPALARGQHQHRNRRPPAAVRQRHNGSILEPQSPMLQSADVIARLRENQRQTPMRLGMIRLQAKSRFVMFASLRQFVVLPQCIRQIDAAHRIAWMLGHSLGVGSARGGAVSGLIQQRPEIVECRKMRRFPRE